MSGIYVEAGDKVSLRLMTTDDTDLIVKWRNNKRVQNNFVYRETFTRQTHENWIKTKISTGEVVQLIICENFSNNDEHNEFRAVGSVYFRDIDNDKKTAEYGIFIGEDDAIGKGYGNETAILALKYAKEVMGLKKVILRAFTYNEAAIKSYKNAGFAETKFLPQVECSDGQKSDMILMEKSL